MCGMHAQRARRYGDPSFMMPELARRIRNSEAQRRRSSLKQTTYRKLLGRHEHRVVMERYLGRALCSEEIVHHIDGDQHNNAIENLQVVTAEEHARIHREQLRRHG